MRAWRQIQTNVGGWRLAHVFFWGGGGGSWAASKILTLNLVCRLIGAVELVDLMVRGISRPCSFASLSSITVC